MEGYIQISVSQKLCPYALEGGHVILLVADPEPYELLIGIRIQNLLRF